MYQVNKTSEILLQALKIPVILHLIEIDFLTKYLVENAVNSISEPLDFNIFWGSMPPDPSPDARASGARFIEEVQQGWVEKEYKNATKSFTKGRVYQQC